MFEVTSWWFDPPGVISRTCQKWPYDGQISKTPLFEAYFGRTTPYSQRSASDVFATFAITTTIG